MKKLAVEVFLEEDFDFQETPKVVATMQLDELGKSALNKIDEFANSYADSIKAVELTDSPLNVQEVILNAFNDMGTLNNICIVDEDSEEDPTEMAEGIITLSVDELGDLNFIGHSMVRTVDGTEYIEDNGLPNDIIQRVTAGLDDSVVIVDSGFNIGDPQKLYSEGTKTLFQNHFEKGDVLYHPEADSFYELWNQ